MPENRERRREHDQAKSSARRAHRRGASVSPDAKRAWRKLRREAKALGMSIDHRVPLKPCRSCGAQGAHEASNFVLLPHDLNSAKGNRCMSCWMSELGRPCVVWLPDQV
jgi:hypothetical protein